MLRRRNLLTLFLAIWETSYCHAKPFLNMGDNISENTTDLTNSSLLLIPAPEPVISIPSKDPPGPLQAVHQDLHPVLLPNPNTSTNGFSLEANHPIATDPAMQIALEKSAAQAAAAPSINTSHPVGANDTALVHPNATHIDALMEAIHQPVPDPDSMHIQPKGPEKAPAVAQGRDMLPSIVGDSNKEVSGRPVANGGLSPATVQQAEGKLPPLEMMPNPFGNEPSHVPVAPEVKPAPVPVNNAPPVAMP
ncbi:uncharacterized protein LOC129591480 [Paramacrobiotus metropolitanus]|uniref:uncharacterized protein LOC129591480 n=1 Tax=Paramacrobiotus metropolitanus TaxID=2943436 RepID=UPI002446098D|nr:uncharacterized protein LOC129591480 [Paramacrobiotus metropolitanus]